MKDSPGLKLALTACMLLPGVLVPYLELNATHLFNPDWPPHARLHEAWQLLSNCAISAFVLWLAWSRQQVRIAAILGNLVIGGFLLAFALRETYGGSMAGTTTGALSGEGFQIGVVLMSVAFVTLLGVALRART